MFAATSLGARHRPGGAPKQGRGARVVYYVFRAGALSRTPLARFTDRAEAVAVARDLERLGWRVAVLSREEGAGASEPLRWRHEYRSPRRPLRRAHRWESLS
jgi:hypothetical protein